jgi:pSer/pThr/pTyr-binding forkhead associated (FHA) protein
MVRISIPMLKSDRLIQLMITEGSAETGDLPGKCFKLKPGDNIIGRDMMCEVVLKSPTISRRHANLRVSFDQRSFIIEDLGSTNGVSLGSLVLKKEKKDINAGSEILIGGIKLKLLVVEEDTESTREVGINRPQ